MKKLNFLIAEDCFLIREGLKKALSSLPEPIIIEETNDLSGLVSKITQSKPDILILGLHFPHKIGELIRDVKTVSSQTKVLILSGRDYELPVISSTSAGISGSINRNISKEEFIKAVREIIGGNTYFMTKISKSMLQESTPEPSGLPKFSERELEVLRYICKGRSNEQIGDLLFLSEKTAATHKRNIMKKAGVKKTSDLIIWALNNNKIATPNAL